MNGGINKKLILLFSAINTLQYYYVNGKGSNPKQIARPMAYSVTKNCEPSFNFCVSSF